jgi:phage replication O-like protein O
MKASISGAELRIAMTVYDRTDGYGRSSDKISMTAFERLTGLSRDSVANAVKQLEGNRIIVISHGKGVTPNEYLFNKHYDTWQIERQASLDFPGSSRENRTTATSQEKQTASSLTHAVPTVEAKNRSSPETITSQVVEPGGERVKKALLKKPIKEEGPSSSPEQTEKNATELLRELVSLKHWRTTEDAGVSQEDVEWLERFLLEFPEFSNSNLAACADYYSSRKGAKGKGDWKNRLRNWMVQERQYAERRKDSGQRHHRTIPRRRDQRQAGGRRPRR